MATRTAIKVIRVPSMPGRGRRAGALARRAGGAAAKAAVAQKHTLFALLGAAAAGYAKKTGIDLPKIDALGVTGTYGGLFLIAGTLMKNRSLEAVGSGLSCVAVYQLAAGDTVSGSDDEISGADDY
jgi:hypothetical protein